jgi:hypothetical protein
MKMEYYLLDLERTIANGRPYFWNGNRHGYTTSLEHAGLFSDWIAEEIVKGDYDKRTVMISTEQVSKILGKDMKPHDGITITTTS